MENAGAMEGDMSYNKMPPPRGKTWESYGKEVLLDSLRHNETVIARGGMTTAEVASMLHIPAPRAHKLIKELKEAGQVELSSWSRWVLRQ